ncbi:alkaline phosphatase family protein [Nocardioides mangrovi]|uniref:Alkaline phosphatase family protein n=1 Tax=Nocardioides mangrovi TaxID=2874580 RepID=A0ABS7U994_9ACTN|nr:alkaline phosphatase family protein [Nocardioides mangrovi]MBZ5737429.1 alkaline phosphatase family protein [Nocardioides mangrovi]
MTSRTARLLLVPLLATTLLGPAAAAEARTAPPGRLGHAPEVTGRVLAISVDGLNTQAIRKLGTDRAPTFHRLLDEGAGTLNARTEYEQNVTLPNHTSMMTSRRIDAARGGHGVTWDDDRPAMTVQKAAGHAVESVFEEVHDAAQKTALFTTKEKFGLYERSWPHAIDRYTVRENQQRLVRLARKDLVAKDRRFVFLHVSLPDRFGHSDGGMSAAYLDAVATTDRQLGTVVDAIADDPQLSDVRIVLTADHGFAPGSTSHSARILANYRIPFVVWGDGVTAGDLYDLNPDYRDPGKRRPGYAAARQPVRNGDLGNLALDLLGLPKIPGSELDAAQDLDVS